MASTNIPEPPTNSEMAASRMTALRSSLENLEKAVTRKGVKRIKESIIRCRKNEAELLEVQHELDTIVVEDCIAEMRSLETRAIEVAAQYYDETIQTVEGLLSIGENPQIPMRSRRTRPTEEPEEGHGREKLKQGEGNPERAGVVSSHPHHDTGTREDPEEISSAVSHSSRPSTSRRSQAEGEGRNPSTNPEVRSNRPEVTRVGSEVGNGNDAPTAKSAASPPETQGEADNQRPGNENRNNLTREQRRRERRRRGGGPERPPPTQTVPSEAGGFPDVNRVGGRGSGMGQRARGRGRGSRGPITPVSSGATARSSGASRRIPISADILDQYSTRRFDQEAIYPETWPLPTEEEFRAKYTKYDIGKTLQTRTIGKFTGKSSDYARFKASFFSNVHVQREPAHIKAGALDSLMDPEVREEMFGIDLGNQVGIIYK